MNSGADDLGRGPLTRWMPVMWQAPAEPPDADPFTVTAGVSPRRFLVRVLFSARRYTIPAAGLAIVWQVGESAIPVVMGVAIDRALATGDVAQLLLWLAVLAGLFVALTVAARFAQRLTEYATQRVEHRLRATLSAKLLHPVGGAAQAPDGGVVSVMTNDVGRLAAIGVTVFPIGEVAAIGFIAVSLLVIHWPLGVVVLIGAPVVVWLMGVLSGRLARQSRVYLSLLAATVGKAADLVSGYRVIKGVRAEAEATRRYRQASGEALVGVRRNVSLLGRFLIGSESISGVFVAGITGLAGWFAVTGQISVGGLIAAVGLTQALLPQMNMLAGNAIPILAAAHASAARVLDARAPDTPPTSTPEIAAGETSAGEARVPENAAASVSVSVPGHDTIAVGAGELVGMIADDRTAAQIADGLLNPHAASTIGVAVDGIPAHQLSPAAYRSHVTVAPHHVTLFTGTIADNLALPAAPPGLRDDALHAAAADDFATGPDGHVGENGNRLSGGQRQRVALARALASDAPVLVLHDPTTAVDSVTESVIAARLRSIRRHRSTLVIASSPALLAVCDRVVDLHAHDTAGATR